MIRGLLVVIFFFIWGSSQAAEVFSRFGAIWIRGPIEAGDSEKFSALVHKDFRKVIIASPGGNVVEAIKIGDVLKASGLPLEVWHYCVSACAGIVFVSATKKSIRSGGFIAFHAGTEGWIRKVIEKSRSYQASNPAEQEIFAANLEKLQSDYASISEAQQRVRNEAGVAPSMGDSILELTSPYVESIEIQEAKRHVAVKVAVTERCEYWVPDLQGLAEMGITVQHYERPERETIADKLHVPENRIYWNALSTVGARNLQVCEGEKHE